MFYNLAGSMVKVIYPSDYMAESEAKDKTAPMDFYGVTGTKAIINPRRECNVAPHYAVGVSSTGELVFGVLALCGDQQGCGSVAYGDIIAPPTDNQDNSIRWVLAVVEVNCGKGWQRRVWALDENGNVTAEYNAPVLLEVEDSQGNRAYIPIGNPLAAIGATRILLMLGTIAGSIVAWKALDWLSQRERREMVEKVVEAAETHPEVVRLVLHPIAGEAADSQGGGWLDQLKNFIITAGTLAGAIVVILKMQVILEFFRSLIRTFRRER